MLRTIRHISLAIAVIACAPAFADIKAFNAAVKAGDYKTAAVEAEAVWKTWDQTDPQTALIAREFGFAALVSGQNAFARDLGKFLVDTGASLKTPDDQPLTSAVLYRIADFKVAQAAAPQRDALRDALFARNGAPGADMTSVLSWQALYTASWNRYDWDAVIKETGGAVEFMKRQPALIPRQREAEVFAVSAAFVHGRTRQTQSRNNYYDKMADIHDAIVADLDAATNATTRSQLWAVKWKATAWAAGMYAYMTSTYEQVGSNISTALKARDLATPKLPAVPEDPALAGMPLCEGKFEGRKVQYPEAKALNGLVGSVIVRIETGADGKATNAEILSAIPVEVFGPGVLSAVKTWTYKPDKGVNTATCRLAGRNHVFRFIFVIGR